MDRSFVRLEAGSSAAEALSELDAADAQWLIVRRPSGPRADWFALPAGPARQTLEAAPADAAVSTALALATTEPTTAVTLGGLVGVEISPSTLIVLAGRTRVVGLLQEGQAVPESIREPDHGAVLVHKMARRSVTSAPAAQHPAAPPAATGAIAAPGAVFSADTHIEAPTVVSVGTPFDLTISLSNPAAIAGEGRLSVMLESGVTEFDLDVQLFAEGFEAPEGLHAKLHVDAERVEDSVLTIPLVAIAPPPEIRRLLDAGEGSTWEASITAFFLYNGNPAGWRVHRLHVQLDPAVAGDAPEPVLDLRDRPDTTGTDRSDSTGTDLVVAALPEPDLTILISDSDPSDGVAGRFRAVLSSPHPTVPANTSYDLTTGGAAATWAAQATKAIKKSEGPMAYEGVRGQGHRIARLVHRDFWDQVNATLRHVATEEQRTPTVLLCTSDPHVPWELAFLDDHPVHADAPPFLAAQARLGRWILDPPNDVPMAPSAEIEIDNVAAVVGEYADTPRWDRLPQAEAEGAFLAEEFGATYRSADGKTIEGLFKRRLRNPPQLIHFACHGTSGQQGNALLSNDGTEFFDFMFEASAAGREDRPFVFLNACRVGAADEALTQYGGFAATFLRSGFTGFIGPLWDVDDTIAHEIATSFYVRAADGESPAEIMRSVRARFVEVEGEDDPPTTYMAYVFYGHPAATISGLRRKGLS